MCGKQKQRPNCLKQLGRCFLLSEFQVQVKRRVAVIGKYFT